MNFIEAFKLWVGKTECPDVYIEWAAMSLIGAACSNHIYLPYRHGNIDKKVYPNLYIVMIGPSGTGKSFALSRAMKMMEMVRDLSEDEGNDRRINIYNGYITHSGLYDELQTHRKKKQSDGTMQTIDQPWRGNLYLLHDELAQDVGSPDTAEMLIRALTGLFMGNMKFSDQTRTGGRVQIEDYMINWLACTNIDWMLAAISPTTLNAGFFRRTIIVTAPPSQVRIPPNSSIPRPDNWEAIERGLIKRLSWMLNHQAAIPMTEEAREVDNAWYLGLANPGADEHGMGVVSGRHDLSLKLALILALAHDEREISAERLAQAQEMTRVVVDMQHEVMPLIRKGEVGTPSDHILQFILAKKGWIGHPKVARYAYDKWAVEAKRFDELIKTWLESGLINERNRNGVKYYRGVT